MGCYYSLRHAYCSGGCYRDVYKRQAVFVSEWMRSAMTTRRRAAWYHALLAAEAAVLGGIAFLPAGVPDAVVIVLVSFVCSMQFNGFRKTHGMPYALSLIHI